MLHLAIHCQNCPANLSEAWNRQQKSAAAILVRYAEGMDTVLLADDVGMGKTYTALTVAAHALLSDQKAKIVLVTPPGLVLKWEQEICSFNDNYVNQKGRVGPVLRPRIIENYWDMLTLLHEYADHERQRVRAKAHACLLRVFCQWHDKEIRSGRSVSRLMHLPGVQNIAEDSPDYLHFCSLFSPRSLEYFFSQQQRTRPQEMKARVAAVREGRSEEGLNELFKEFCRQQREHTPNIFILRMSGLRRGGIDTRQSRLLHTWLAMRVLAKLWATKREAGIRSVLQWAYCPSTLQRGGSAHKAWLEELAVIDLWGLRDMPFPEQEADKARLALLTQADDQGSALEDLHIALVRCKMAQTGFSLAIVDEAHNWKGGKNGAGAFQKNYAPHIHHTLLLTATPFQMHPQELKVILQHVATQPVQSPSVVLVEELTRPDGLFNACLSASQRFERAWQGLPVACDRWLQNVFVQSKPVADIVHSLAALPDAPQEMASFAEAIMEWHTRMQDLRKPLMRILIRHTKSRRYRHFHAGCDYATGREPSFSPHRPNLYDVMGYGGEEDALISYIAMRTDQLLRRESQDGTGNAHLREGLSSSFAAFLESHKKKHTALTKLSEATKTYVDFLKKSVKHVEHPKVKATVERAVYNFRQGKKTLIFCERLATQQELYKKFCQRVIEDCFSGKGLARAKKWREAILRVPLLVDWYLSRSQCLLTGTTLNAAQRQRAATEAQTQARQLRLRGQRRLARLLDLHLLKAISNPSPLASMFVQLIENVDFINSYLLMETHEQEQEEITIDFEKMATSILTGQNIWHTGKNPRELHELFWDLLHRECSAPLNEHRDIQNVIPVLLALPQGLRRILLRLDVLQQLPRRGQEQRRSAGLVATAWLKRLFAKDEQARRAWDDTVKFLENLRHADGRLLGATSRRESLWRGVSLKQQGRKAQRQAENLFADKLNGSTAAERRTALCAAFNAPIYPYVLLCTAIGSEGIDLHRCCAEVIHHDLPWNPARLEQRNGRIDRVGSLAEKECRHMYFGIPFLAHDYEDYQYKTVHQRSQRMEVLLGVGAAYGESEEELLLESGSETVREIENAVPTNEEPAYVRLPERLVEYLRMDFGVME